LAQGGAAKDSAPNAEKLLSLVRSLFESSDPEEQILLGQQVLHLDDQFAQWPLSGSREQARGTVWIVIANAYAKRGQGVPTENFEKAITAQETAAAFLTREKYPEEWEQIQASVVSLRRELITAWMARFRVTTDPNERLAAMEQLSEVEKQLPEWPFPFPKAQMLGLMWGMVGDSFWKRSEGFREENLEHAIKAYEAALLQFQPIGQFPKEWRNTEETLVLVRRE